MNPIARLTLLLLCSAPLAAQQGSFTPFGTGCTLLRQTLSISPGSTAPPRIGSTILIAYSGPNFTFNNAQQIAQPFLAVGFGTSTVVIPSSILPQQPTGCMGFISPFATIPTTPDPNQTGQFTSTIGISIPASQALVGASFFAQWLTVFEQCGFAGCNIEAVATSDAAQITLGR